MVSSRTPAYIAGRITFSLMWNSVGRRPRYYPDRRAVSPAPISTMAPPRLNRPLVPLSDRRWPLAVVVLLGVSCRAVYALTYGPPSTDVYTWELATGLLETQTLAYAGAITTHFEPLHPAWLA